MTAPHGFAPAKINLFLHVGALGADGYHPLTSWMVFADIGDRVVLTPSKDMAVCAEGPFAGDLPNGAENMVVRARDRVLEAAGAGAAPFALTLDKQLPVASGMGGGSSDAAAVLRLVGGATGIGDDVLHRVAAELGSDVPACLVAASVMARGRGERLSPGPAIPPLPAVLVNPGTAVSTRQVFEAFDKGPTGDLSDGSPPARFGAIEDVAAFLSRQRNDLAAPATIVQPVIGEVLAALQAAPQTLLARMTGSGATAFALCATDAAAANLAGRISVARPAWWVRNCRLA